MPLITNPASTKRYAAWRAFFFLWLAMLTYGLPEVIAGTGSMWIITPSVYILAGPLYLLHFLFFVQIARWSGRTSWSALYLFGVIFGLYETWVTKVVWAGYPDQDGFVLGGIGPWFGIHETLGLVLFYHAVVSFLLPLAVMSRLFPEWAKTFPVPDWVFGQSRWALGCRVALLVMLGVVTGHNNPVLPAYLLTWLPFLVVLIMGYSLLRKTGAILPGDIRAARISGPHLGRVGLFVVCAGLIAIYVVSFIFFRPTGTPAATALIITAAFYPLLALLIARTKRQILPKTSQRSAPGAAGRPLRWLVAIFGFGAVMLLLVGAGIDLRGTLAPVAFLSMIPIGAGLFFWLGLWRGLIRRQ